MRGLCARTGRPNITSFLLALTLPHVHTITTAYGIEGMVYSPATAYATSSAHAASTGGTHLVACRSAARASKRVESSTGSGEFPSFTSSGISVQPSTTASHPRRFSPSITCWK